jgi:hypothetical protein
MGRRGLALLIAPILLFPVFPQSILAQDQQALAQPPVRRPRRLATAYYNQEQGVMNVVQVMRRRAQQAGHLNSSPQQTVTTEGSNIEIEEANPDIVYVPAYDPWDRVRRPDSRMA